MTKMYEDGFDPLSRLNELEDKQQEIIHVLNQQASFIEELSRQNYAMSKQLKEVTDRLIKLQNS